MPVPKRKTSKSRRDKRQSCKFVRPKALTECTNCKEPLNAHQACGRCGYYKGRKIFATKLDRTLRKKAAGRAQDTERAPEGQE
jgi:large subunit ribosomal protein L32